jgi:hypothetical protein
LESHHLGGGDFLLRVDVDGDAAAVVDDGDRVVDVNRHVDAVAIAGERFVDRVVDDFINEVVKSHVARRADVHRGAFAHGVPAFEDRDRGGAVFLCICAH